MQQKTFKHPVHAINAMRAVMKRVLRDLRPSPPPVINYPSLVHDKDYFFLFETRPRSEDDKMLFSICCFAEDGEIIFNRLGEMPVGLWRFRRQGEMRTSTMISGVIRQSFMREYMPLIPDDPFKQVSEGLFRCNINWSKYHHIVS